MFLCTSSPPHHLLVSSPPTVLPHVQGVVGQRVLGLVAVVGSQQRPGPDAHIVRRQRPPELGRQTLRLEELVERVQVVTVEEDLHTRTEETR